MNFKHYSAATIDFSPHPTAQSVTLLLEESNLAPASKQQFERFWRVWSYEQSAYAPGLKTVTIVVRPHRSPINSKCTYGIRKFLEYGRQYGIAENVKVYLDNYVQISENTVQEVTNEPTIIDINSFLDTAEVT